MKHFEEKSFSHALPLRTRNLKKVSKLVIHYGANPGTSAKANLLYLKETWGTENPKSIHFIVDLDGSISAQIPTGKEAFHAGLLPETKRNPFVSFFLPKEESPNLYTVGIEVCHPDESGKFTKETEEALIDLCKALCIHFKLDPRKDICRHYDISGKLCPKYWVEYSEKFDAFKSCVAALPAEKVQ